MHLADSGPIRIHWLTVFGLAAVSFTLLCYWLEKRGPLWILGFALGCALSSIYGFMQGAWPFGIVEIFWTAAALRRWLQEKDLPPREAALPRDKEKANVKHAGA